MLMTLAQCSRLFLKASVYLQSINALIPKFKYVIPLTRSVVGALSNNVTIKVKRALGFCFIGSRCRRKAAGGDLGCPPERRVFAGRLRGIGQGIFGSPVGGRDCRVAS